MMLRHDTRGAVMVETVLAFMPLLMLFLGIVQYALLAAAQLVVQHAAVAGARSASVVLDDDPARYERVERLVIQDDGSSDASAPGDLIAIGALLIGGAGAELPAPAGLTSAVHGYGARVAPVRNAVYGKLAAIVPSRALASLVGAPGSSVLDALGRSPELRLAQAPLYLPVTTAITFPRAPGSSALFEDRVDAEAPITVRVTHVATCTIPLVAAFMCRTLKELREEERAELERAPAASFQDELAESGVRAVLLRAEASMPLQHAPYKYVSQREAPP